MIKDTEKLIFGMREFCLHAEAWSPRPSQYRMQWIKSISGLLQTKWKIAFIVFTLANVLFCLVSFSIADHLKKKILLKGKKFTPEEKQFVNFVIDFFVIGGMTFLFNALLSRAVNYPLSKIVITAITITTISLRIITRSN